MEYLFLRRKKCSATSERQKALLYRAARRQWQQECATALGKNTAREADASPVRRVDGDIYKGVLYLLEVRRVFLDASLSLKKLSEMLETNQTYLSNAVNRYFGCNLKSLVNTYRVEYAKELLRSGRCPAPEVGRQSGFRSQSAYYAAFGEQVGISPLRYRRAVHREGSTAGGPFAVNLSGNTD